MPYSTQKACDITPGWIILRYGILYYVVRTNRVSMAVVEFIVKPITKQWPISITAETLEPILAKQAEPTRHQHFWSEK